MIKSKDIFFRKFREYIFDNNPQLFDDAIRFASSKTNEDPEDKIVEMTKRSPSSKFVQDFIGSWL